MLRSRVNNHVCLLFILEANVLKLQFANDNALFILFGKLIFFAFHLSQTVNRIGIIIAVRMQIVVKKIATLELMAAG